MKFITTGFLVGMNFIDDTFNDVFAWHWGLCFRLGVTQVMHYSDATAGENMFAEKLLYCTQCNSLSVIDEENTDQKVY